MASISRVGCWRLQGLEAHCLRCCSPNEGGGGSHVRHLHPAAVCGGPLLPRSCAAVLRPPSLSSLLCYINVMSMSGGAKGRRSLLARAAAGTELPRFAKLLLRGMSQERSALAKGCASHCSKALLVGSCAAWVVQHVPFTLAFFLRSLVVAPGMLWQGSFFFPHSAMCRSGTGQVLFVFPFSSGCYIFSPPW